MPENRSRFKFFFAPVVTTLLLFCAMQTARAQTLARATDNSPTSHTSDPANSESRNSSSRENATPDVQHRVQALEDALVEERKRLDELQRVITDQQRLIQQLSGSAANETSAPNSVAASNSTAATPHAGTVDVNQVPSLEDRIKRVEGQVARIGPFRLSGDFRLRTDITLRSATDPPEPQLQHVQNARVNYRLRLNFDTDLYPRLSFHGQLATGAVNNHLSNNQDFGEVAVRHPFFINEVWIDYHPTKALSVQGGRVQEIFADNSRFLFDDDIRFNGFNERYTLSFKKNSSDVTSVELRAGQYILSNPNVAIITPGSPLATAGEAIGTTGRSANLFHQGVLVNQQFNKKWSDQIGADVQLYRHPNQIQLASTAAGVVLIVQPGIGLVLSGPLPGSGNATTTPGGAIYTAGRFQIARLAYRLSYAGFKSGDHAYPVTFNIQLARNIGTSVPERDAMLAALQIGKVTKTGDMAFLYVFSIKGANSLISQVTDDDLGTGTGVNIRAHHLRFDYGLAKKVTFQSLLFFQNQLRNSADFPSFFVPLGAFAPHTIRLQEQLLFTF